MTGTEQPDQVSLPTEIGGCVKLSVGIANPLSPYTKNQMDPTIQPTIDYSIQATRPGRSDWEYSPLGNFSSGTDVPINNMNIVNLMG